MEETLDALDAVVRAARFRYWALQLVSVASGHGARDAEANGGAASLMARCTTRCSARVERDVIPMMQHHGLGMSVGPLAFVSTVG